jgi:hypothetical protein
MAARLEAHARQAFQAETRHVMARRTPLGVGFSVVLVAVAGLLERAFFPERGSALLWSFALEILLCAAAFTIARSRRLRRLIIPLVTVAMLGVAALISGYVTVVGASGDALAFALIIFLTGIALLLPWGVAGQVPLALGTVGAYLLALAAGVRGELPPPHGLLSVAGGRVTSVLGARFLDLHRQAIFAQRRLLEQTRDQQMAMLYDVTRTVTATLELRRCCGWCAERLRALGSAFMAFWRAAPEGDLRALRAERTGEDVRVHGSAGRPAGGKCCSTPRRAGSGAVRPECSRRRRSIPRRPAGTAAAVAAGVSGRLVGVIVADCGARTSAPEPSSRFHRHPRQQRGDGVAKRLHARAPTPRRAAADLQKVSDVAEESIRRLRTSSMTARARR